MIPKAKHHELIAKAADKVMGLSDAALKGRLAKHGAPPADGPGPDGSPEHEGAESPELEAAEQAAPGGDAEMSDADKDELRRLYEKLTAEG